MQGAGFVCHFILDSLATQALKVSRPILDKPEIKIEDSIKTEIAENNNEIILEKVEEEQYTLFHSDDDLNASDDEEDEMDVVNQLNLREARKLRDFSAKPTDEPNDKTGMLSGEMWKMEMERAMPRLKIVVKNDLKDWSSRWEQMKVCQENIEAVRTACFEAISNIAEIFRKIPILTLFPTPNFYFFDVVVRRYTISIVENPSRCLVRYG